MSTSHGAVARRRDLGGRHEFPVPSAALKIDDVGYVDMARDSAERRHRVRIQHTSGHGVLQSIEHHVDVLCRVVLVDDAAAPKYLLRQHQAFERRRAQH